MIIKSCLGQFPQQLGCRTVFTGRPYLVTGGAGFYGVNLLSRLSGVGARVFSVCRDLSKVVSVAGQRCEWVEADLADREQTDHLLERTQPSIVFHLTSASLGGTEIENVGASMEGDLLPTINLLESAPHFGKPRVVLPSSMEEPFPVADFGWRTGHPYDTIRAFQSCLRLVQVGSSDKCTVYPSWSSAAS